MNNQKEWNEHSGPIIDSLGDYDVIECQKCEFIHKVPLPNQDEWDSFYTASFYNLDDKNTYLEETERDDVYREILHEDKYLNLKKLLAKNNLPRVLDIGSGGGLFIKYLQDKGWNASGVEPSKKATEFALERNRPTINCTIEDFIQNNTKRFDVVHLRAVLDNIIDPITVIRGISEKILNKRGICVVDTPNEYNKFQLAAQKLYNIEKWWLKGDTINFFNLESLMNLFKTSNLDICHYESSFPLELFPLMGYNYIGDDKIGKQSHVARVEFENNLRKVGMWDLKMNLYKSFAENGIGRYITVYGRKN